jgi:hypothetical protein
MATRAIFTPEGAQYPSADFPGLVTVHTTERRRVLAFDASTSEACAWAFVAPVGLTGTLTAIVTFSAASATSGNGQFDVSIEADTVPADGLDTDAATGYDTANTHTAVTVPGTAGAREIATITLTNDDGMAAGDSVRIKLARNIADTAAGDLYVHTLEFRDAA